MNEISVRVWVASEMGFLSVVDALYNLTSLIAIAELMLSDFELQYYKCKAKFLGVKITIIKVYDKISLFTAA